MDLGEIFCFSYNFLNDVFIRFSKKSSRDSSERRINLWSNRKTLLTITLFDCNIDTEVVSIWIEKDLLPKLPNESILVMDNASFHKSKAMQEKIKARGHTLEYLPPYSPDLNPIEHKWAQAKSKRRNYQCEVDELFKGDYL